MSVDFHDWRALPGEWPTGVVHVYFASLADAGTLDEHLTDDERARANRFRLARVREQFVATRGHLRRLLGHYLAMTPRDVPILYADGGKPYLPEEHPLHFNVSHTDGVAVFAFGRAPIGVDVERPRPIPDADSLVARFFSPAEAQAYSQLPDAERTAAFFRAWTRKEAILKGIGRGVRSLDCCTVTFLEGERPRLVWLADDASAPDRWELTTWQPAPGLEAAIAYHRQC